MRDEAGRLKPPSNRLGARAGSGKAKRKERDRRMREGDVVAEQTERADQAPEPGSTRSEVDRPKRKRGNRPLRASRRSRRAGSARAKR
jgi:hypothetical protein